MAVDKLQPNDTRVEYRSCQVRGKRYGYILGEPEGSASDAIFLLHGFPDLGFGWRYQIPHFMSLGFRVVVPDMLGYGATDAPVDLRQYSTKHIAHDVKALAETIVGDSQIILGGHDMGGSIVWETCRWHPELVKAAFSVCTPLIDSPQGDYVSLEDMIASGTLQHFKYQLQLKGPEVENRIQGRSNIRQFLNAMYGGSGPNGEPGVTAVDGVIFDNLSILGQSPLVSADELEYYSKQYLLRDAPQLRGPLNWYRVGKINHDDDEACRGSPTWLEMPALFIAAKRDVAVPPSLSQGMEKLFKNLTRGEVNASHWALWQASEEINKQITDWLQSLNGSLR